MTEIVIEKKKRGFLLGKIYIFCSIFFGGLGSLYALGQLAMAVMQHSSSLLAAGLVSLPLGILSVVIGYGLMHRKRWAWVLVIAYLSLYLLVPLFASVASGVAATFAISPVAGVPAASMALVTGLFCSGAILNLLWIFYFYRRKSLFN